MFALAVAAPFDWRWNFGIGAIGIAVCTSGIAFFPERKARNSGRGRLLPRLARIWRAAAAPPVLLLCAAHVAPFLTFVAMHAELAPHLSTIGMQPTQVIWMRLFALPGMFVAATGR